MKNQPHLFSPSKVGRWILLSSFLIHPSSLLANDAVMIKPPVSGLQDIFQPVNFPTAHPLNSEGLAIHFGNTANKIPILDSGGHFVLAVLPTTGLPSLAFGNTTQTSTATPLNLNLGGTYSNLAGGHPKLILFDNGAVQWGLGLSSTQMDFMVPTGAGYGWYVNGVRLMNLPATGLLTLNVGLNSVVDGMTLGVGTGTGMADTPTYTMTPTNAYNFNIVKVGFTTTGGLTARITGDRNMIFDHDGIVATVGGGPKPTSDDTIASAATLVLNGRLGSQADVTGTTPITAITLANGSEYTVKFTGALTLTNNGSILLPGGANIPTANGDYAVFSGGAAGVVTCVSYKKASGAYVANFDGGTVANATFNNAAITGSTIATSRLITLTSNGFVKTSASNGTLGVDSTSYEPSNLDLDAVAALSSTGLAARTGTNTWSQRTITGTANEIAVTNGNGVSGNPTLSLPSALTYTGKTVTGGTFTGAILNNQSFLNNFSTAAQGPITSATYLTGSRIAVPTGKLQIGTVFQWTFNMTKTAAGTTHAVSIMIGTAGNISDTVYTGTGTITGTAAVDEGFYTVTAIIRGPLSASCVLSAEWVLVHNGNTVGFATIPVSVTNSISSTFDATTANLFVGLDLGPGLGSSYTVQQITANAWNL